MKQINFVILFLLAVAVFSPVSAGWVSVPIPPARGGQTIINGLYFVSPDLGWAVGGSALWKTIDGAKSWKVLPNPQSAPLVDHRGVYFLNSQEGWVVGSGATTLHTTDGGETWEIQIWKSVGLDLWAIKAMGDELWSVGGGWSENPAETGVLLRSRDHGETWTQTNFRTGYFLNLEVISEDNIWLIGLNVAVQTRDKGRTWIDQSASLKSVPKDESAPFEDMGVAFRGIAFTSLAIGYLVGNKTSDWGGKLFATADSGRTWTIRKDWGHEMQPNGMAIVGNTIYVAGDDLNESGPNDVASVITSNDEGYTWREVLKNTDRPSDAGLVKFGDILYTASAEYFWRLVPNQSPLFAVNLGIQQISIAEQWQYQPRASDPDGDPLSFQLLEAPGFLAIDPDSGTLFLKTALTVSDIGDHKVVVQVSDPEGLTDIWTFVLPIVGQITAVEGEEAFGLPTKFALRQNYPNPFNASTVIRYSLPRAGEVRLAVYALTGQEVATLIFNRQEAGVYSINFDASNLPTGIYLYRLKTVAGESETKKMILVK